VFSKNANRFNAEAFQGLLAIAAPQGSGIYLAPAVRKEQLYTNLLQIKSYAPTLFIADTPFRHRHDVWEKLHEVDEHYGEWLLKEGRIYSFHDLREFPWQRVCDRGAVEDFNLDEWALSEDPERRRDFVYLVRRCLSELLYPEVRWHKELRCSFFTLPRGKNSRSIEYESHARKSKRTVVEQYPRTVDGRIVTLYRHYAFWDRLRRFDGRWYLEISPTYAFTYNGRDVAYQHEDWVKGIKRRERNRAVVAQLLLWAQYIPRLGRGSMFDPPYAFLSFGELGTFDVDVGIDDRTWRKDEDEGEADVLQDPTNRLALPGFGDEPDDSDEQGENFVTSSGEADQTNEVKLL